MSEEHTFLLDRHFTAQQVIERFHRDHDAAYAVPARATVAVIAVSLLLPAGWPVWVVRYQVFGPDQDAREEGIAFYSEGDYQGVVALEIGLEMQLPFNATLAEEDAQLVANYRMLLHIRGLL